ncbi:hypothetical protein CDAR_60301 [Caerostris darwini]|uniref:Uncharacterized protein n=1 Tax=Caerostris darwini TaxID=1538125 RepID=A0AAV4QI69_9ARAC|nr:hypothetical protein CDAR_60301 [Caerostris darwini]
MQKRTTFPPSPEITLISHTYMMDSKKACRQNTYRLHEPDLILQEKADHRFLACLRGICRSSGVATTKGGVSKPPLEIVCTPSPSSASYQRFVSPKQVLIEGG